MQIKSGVPISYALASKMIDQNQESTSQCAGHLPGHGFESLPESLSFFPLFIFLSLFHTFFSDFDRAK